MSEAIRRRDSTVRTLVCLLHLYAAPFFGVSAGEPQTLFRNGEGYNAFRIPALIQASNGDLLAFCEARAGGDASEIDLVLRRSRDGGVSWDPIEVVQESDDFVGVVGDSSIPITVGNPAPVVDLLDPEHEGRIWLMFTLENDKVFVICSDDHGRSWSDRREITSSVKLEPWGWYATGPGHAIQIQNGTHRGRLVVAADHRIGEDGADSGANGAQAIFSDDHGKTWQLGAVDDSYEDGLNANETMLVELADGRLYFNTRDQHGPAKGTRGAAHSSDGGETFDPASSEEYRYFSPTSEVLDPPVVQCGLLRVDLRPGKNNQGIILFSGPDESGPSGKGRSDLRIRYSTDEANSWQDGLLIHIGPAAYSDMVQVDADTIAILYEAGDVGNSRYDRIDFLRLPLALVMKDTRLEVEGGTFKTNMGQ